MTGTGSGLRTGQDRSWHWLLIAGCLLYMAPLPADPVPQDGTETPAARDFRSLDREIQVLKREILELNRDLRLLEEDVLYPADQQLVVFISLPTGTATRLQSVTITLGGQLLARHAYRTKELAALLDGGVHRLYEGRLEPGSHYLDIAFAGVQAGGDEFTASSVVKITKRAGAKFIELQLAGGSDGQSPEIMVNTW